MSIFASNSTNLSEIKIAEATLIENFNLGTGIADALIEGAASDLAFFNFMLETDAKEIMANENGEVISEGQLADIASKAARAVYTLIMSLASKLKSVYYALSLKMIDLTTKDMDLINNFGRDIEKEKSEINKINVNSSYYVAWHNCLTRAMSVGKKEFDQNIDVNRYSEDPVLRFAYYSECQPDEFKDKVFSAYFEKVLSDFSIKDYGGIDKVINYFKRNKRTISEFARTSDKEIRKIENKAAIFKKMSIQANLDSEHDYWAKIYRMISAFRDVQLRKTQYIKECMIKEYKQNHRILLMAVGKVVKKESTLLECILDETSKSFPLRPVVERRITCKLIIRGNPTLDIKECTVPHRAEKPWA